jgi:polar amino acid transport system permease protein
MTYFEFLGEHGPTLLMGATTTVKVLVCSTILYVIISMIFGLMRISKNPIIQGIATVYIEIFRGTSLLVQLFWFYYVLPFFGISLEAFVAGVLSLGMNFGAYGAEIVRGGILAVPKGQWEAAHALNFSPVKRIKRIIIPQIFSNCTPASCKSYSGIIKSYFISSSSDCC